MRFTIYVVAALLAIGWVVIFFGNFTDSPWVHVIIVIAVLLILINTTNKRGDSKRVP